MSNNEQKIKRYKFLRNFEITSHKNFKILIIWLTSFTYDRFTIDEILTFAFDVSQQILVL
jgi:hypothetical protein